jgi:hypothetical protein
MMNNLRENNCSVFDSSDPDPKKWKKVAHVEDPLWGGKYHRSVRGFRHCSAACSR